MSEPAQNRPMPSAGSAGSKSPLDSYESRLLKRYEEASRVVGQFFEWRHKVILLASTTLALVFAISSWMYSQDLGGEAMGFPLLAGAAMSAMFALFDRRNGMIIAACYESAIAHEKAMWADAPPVDFPMGVYERIKATRDAASKYEPERWTYGWVLRAAYLSLAVVLALLAISAFLIGWLQPDWLVPSRPPTGPG